MRIDVTFTAEELEVVDLSRQRVLVIDVIRSTTTMLVAFHHGCSFVIPALTPEEAMEKAQAFPPGQVLLCGSRDGQRLPGFELGNSPQEYTRERVKGKGLILTTSNGTRALLAARRAEAVAIASLLNVSAASAWAVGPYPGELRRVDRDLTLACSGCEGRFAAEDAVCAGLIVEKVESLVRGNLVKGDGAHAAEILGRHTQMDLLQMLRRSRWGAELEQRGWLEDLRPRPR